MYRGVGALSIADSGFLCAKPAESDRQKAETEKKKADERATDEAYKSTIKRIPDAGQKPDPWGNMRAPAAKGNN